MIISMLSLNWLFGARGVIEEWTSWFRAGQQQNLESRAKSALGHLPSGEDALTSTNYEQIHFGTHLDKWVDFHMLGGTGSGDSITGKILSESKPTAGTGQGRRNKSIFVILTIRDNNGKHPKPNLLSPTLQGLARHLSTVATAYINLKIFLSDSIHMLYFDWYIVYPEKRLDRRQLTRNGLSFEK